MGYDARTTAFASLSAPMRLALIDLVSRRGMYRTAEGYLGAMVHLPATMYALESRNLIDLFPSRGRPNRAQPTKTGERVIRTEFSGDAPQLVDCDAVGRRR